MSLLPAAQEHLLAKAAKEKKPEEHKQKFMQAVTDLSKAFALAVPNEKAIEIRDDVGFFQAVRAVLAKGDGEKRKTADEMDYPPDKQEKATQTVLQQAELLCAEWGEIK